jgi:hypothetical protein
MEYPALYNDADSASKSAQSEFLILVVAEFALLTAAAIFSLEPFGTVPFLIFYALIFLAALALMLLRTLRKADQDWYKCRALAESIKTSAWRYAMCAHPFDEAGTQDARRDFLIFLKAIFDANQHIGPRIAGLSPEGQQITVEMDDLRNRSLAERKEIYLMDRIREQRTWYANKARYNRKRLRLWIVVCAIVYLVAATSVLMRIPYTNANLPTEPLIVIASSLVGWIQIKRYAELASAYSLAAHEIGIVEGRIPEANTNAKFSDFVNEAELAFSREHIQWIARQHEV